MALGPLSGEVEHPAGASPSKCIIIMALFLKMSESWEEAQLFPSRVKQLFRESFAHTQMHDQLRIGAVGGCFDRIRPSNRMRPAGFRHRASQKE
jgi:hypothetical protein